MLPNIGAYGDARTLADLVHDAEAAGWDGVFVWDTFQMPEADGHPVADAWVALAAIAMRTERIVIGPRVSAPPRMRPWVLAQQWVTFDHLSGGSLVLDVGIGDASDRGFNAFGKQTDARARAVMLDESLTVLDVVWSGEPFAFAGEHYRLDAVRFLPRPVQRPRIPVWVAGTWPKPGPMARAARWDAVISFRLVDGVYGELRPEDAAALGRFGDERRGAGSAWDIAIDAPVLAARKDMAVRDHLTALADAGAT